MSKRKSFAEILKENLTEKSFKNKQPKLVVPTSLILDPFKKEISDFFINIKDLSRIHSSRTFYAKLFKIPIKISFYWCEEDWQGSIFTVYEYNDKFISVKEEFGSCDYCYELPDSQERLDKIFSHLVINENINDINIHGNHPEYTHPELMGKFNTWKEIYHQNYEKIKETKQNEQINVKLQEIKELNFKESWADIVSKKK